MQKYFFLVKISYLSQQVVPTSINNRQFSLNNLFLAKFLMMSILCLQLYCDKNCAGILIKWKLNSF